MIGIFGLPLQILTPLVSRVIGAVQAPRIHPETSNPRMRMRMAENMRAMLLPQTLPACQEALYPRIRKVIVGDLMPVQMAWACSYQSPYRKSASQAAVLPVPRLMVSRSPGVHGSAPVCLRREIAVRMRCSNCCMSCGSGACHSITSPLTGCSNASRVACSA